MDSKNNQQSAEQWGLFELALDGPATGNPFVDVSLSAQFTYKNRVITTDGFYDGDGVYHVRFMPDTVGEWSYITRSNAAALDGITGGFTCVEPAANNHGPVRVHNTHHFAYADGTPYFQVGTTCYVWNHQGDALEQQTLETLAGAPFTKMRMCVFPKNYVYNQNEPVHYPFVGEPLRDWDFTRFNPGFFQHLDKRIVDLMNMGIEADLILFHPYDRWGFAEMDADSDDRYLRYVVARLAAYRNVWWSMANEYDFMKSKSESDWDRFFRVVQESDPYQHLRSIHNGRLWYDHNKPWVTHASVQSYEAEKTTTWRDQYRKPIVIDECRYEGDIPNVWGNITGEDMTRLFWEGTLRGGYVGHGETYQNADDILWWSKGGVLHGSSPARIAFYKQVLGQLPLAEFEPIPSRQIMGGGHYNACMAHGDAHFLMYYGRTQPGQVTFTLPEGNQYRLTLIDTWAMTLTSLDQTFTGTFEFKLPGKSYIAVQFEKID